jgi:hypothetical protein
MTKRLTRIAPWQAGKLLAIVYFLFSLILMIPFYLLMQLAPPPPPGSAPKFASSMVFIFPFLYGMGGLILVPLFCWLYNLSARFVGGLEVAVTNDVDA